MSGEGGTTGILGTWRRRDEKMAHMAAGGQEESNRARN